MQGATLSHPRYYPHMLALALNIPHNKAKGSDKSYYFQPSHLKARGEATLFLDVLLGKQTSSPKKLPKAEHMPNMARQAWRKLAFSSASVSTIEKGSLCGQLRGTTIH